MDVPTPNYPSGIDSVTEAKTPMSFTEAIRDLPQAVETTVAY
jgi:hypothetical protein